MGTCFSDCIGRQPPLSENKNLFPIITLDGQLKYIHLPPRALCSYYDKPELL